MAPQPPFSGPWTDKHLKLSFEATFGDEILPFRISVKQDFLDLTKLKVSLTRFTEDQECQEENVDGPSQRCARDIARFWANDYDWRSVEARLNQDMNHFTTTVQTPLTEHHRYADPVPLHFVHHKSSRPDAIPLLFVHGWPGSFVEVESLIAPLTDPPDTGYPAFHVVAPSIPGYGFSPAPRTPGFGYRQAGATFRALMLKLGYDRYVFQGGDAGDLINRYAAVDFPDNVVSGVSNFWVTPPREEDLVRRAQNQTSDDETYVIDFYQNFVAKSWGYAQLQQTRPLRLAIGLTDSPVGLAMWIYDGLRPGVMDPAKVWTPDRIVTWTMMHWIGGPYGAFSLYKNGAQVSQTSYGFFIEMGGTMFFFFPTGYISSHPLEQVYDAFTAAEETFG
jgi:pimeloyl-ACP methyl ester carboxylesterase